VVENLSLCSKQLRVRARSAQYNNLDRIIMTLSGPPGNWK